MKWVPHSAPSLDDSQTDVFVNQPSQSHLQFSLSLIFFFYSFFFLSFLNAVVTLPIPIRNLFFCGGNLFLTAFLVRVCMLLVQFRYYLKWSCCS